MPLSEERAKDLARIEPPSSMKKIVQFAEQITLGQGALFAGTDLPKARPGALAADSQTLAATLASKPYSIFPGAGGESFDETMARNTIRTRDIQDFTRWLVNWESKYSQLRIGESPEQFFLTRATPELVETYFHQNPEIERIVLEGRRRRRVVEEVVVEEEVVERVEKKRTRRALESRSAEEAQAAEERSGPFGKRRQASAEESSKHREPVAESYWKDQPRADMQVVRPATAQMAAASSTPSISLAQVLSGLNRSVATSNLGFGSLTGGLLRGRADATESMQAQMAASQAVQSSPVAPTFLPQQPALQRHYPAPDVQVTRVPLGQVSSQPQVASDWDSSSSYRVQNGIVVEVGPASEAPADLVALPRRVAESRGLRGIPATAVRGAATTAAAAALLAPGMAFAAPPLPGATGAASQAFANHLALKAAGSSPISTWIVDGSAVPAGTVQRRDIMSLAAAEHLPEPIMRGLAAPEPAVRTSIPANPLMGQITLISAPLNIASADAERSGTAVSVDVKQLAKGAGAIDAAGLAMLKTALPAGVQAIYPALPEGSLGPQAVNLKLAPSLLTQILSQGYGPQATGLASQFAAAASNAGLQMPVAEPMAARLVPMDKRPTDASAGLLGDERSKSSGALDQAGAGSASRGGALDFLGMPVRLAPSLSGNAELKQEADVRKVVPAGAAAVIRPNEFGPIRSKLFPSFGSVQAEPDKAKWEKAAPSFGLRSARPETLLAPDSRVRPPKGGASLPQMMGGPSNVAQALGTASMMRTLASAASAPTPSFGSGSSPLGLPSAPGSGMSLGSLPSIGGSIQIPFSPGGRLQTAVPSLGMPLAVAAPAMPAMMGMHGPATIALMGGLGSTGPVAALGAGAAATSSRIASRWSPSQPMGAGASLSLPESPSFSTPAVPSPMRKEHAGSGRSPAMPTMRAGIPATPDVTSSHPGYNPPSMAQPAVPTTAGAYTGLGPLPTPAAASMSLPSLGAATSTPTLPGILSNRTPEMPIARMVPAKPTPAQAAMVQRARTGEVASNPSTSQGRSPQQSSTDGTKNNTSGSQDVNKLANEVWSLLRRRIRFESERAGYRYQ